MKDFNTVNREICEDLQVRLNGICDDIESDLATLESPDVALLSKYPEFRRALEVQLGNARTTLDTIRDSTAAAYAEAKE